jgi:hypothetical protein
MSGTNYRYQNLFNKILSKIDTILNQVIKTKRVVNDNNIKIKKVNKNLEYVFETIHHSVLGTMNNQVITGYGTNVCYSANCAFPTLTKIVYDADSIATPGSGLGCTDGTDSDIVSNLVKE